ncbi:hypothetical protein [Aurantimonas coralicida]|uniref:hypothetical protein n=1 Tax=Aurantimonas coralicida TaxID=182270 RepID=UPI001E595F49|nr:hypothetical protein [Aurantimonas coralicida]MCD1642727.1 hypothetical protein [Aurantimonas coralicida]
MLHAMQYDCKPDEYKSAYMKSLEGDAENFKLYLSKLPNFKHKYQEWYSKAQELIRQVLPNRLQDFVSYFEIPKGRKDITFQNYMIRDYLQGLQVTRGWDKEVLVGGAAAIPEFVQQLNMVKAAKGALDSALIDLKAVLQADLFDSEIETAVALAKAGYLRAAGAICGVVLEKHLLHICGTHKLTVHKKNPGISDLNQILRNGEVTTIPQWRFIQHLGDIRNICDHAKGREPTKDEIDDLVIGAQKTLKTIA